MEKIKLDAYETAVLLTTKHHKVKLSRDIDKEYVFTGEEEILNHYRDVVYVYIDRTYLPIESLQLRHITSYLLDIFHLCRPEDYKRLIIDMSTYYNKKYSYNANLFKQLYGYLQALKMRDGEEEFFDLDESLIINEY